MGDTVFSLVFATTGMLVVFLVISFITVMMVITGSIFAEQGRRAQGAARQAPAEAGRVPEDHLAVIAAALAIHTMGRMKKIALMADAGTWWGATDRARPGGTHIPRLRRTK